VLKIFVHFADVHVLSLHIPLSYVFSMQAKKENHPTIHLPFLVAHVLPSYSISIRAWTRALLSVVHSFLSVGQAIHSDCTGPTAAAKLLQ
jgi:hypothetical protein